MLGKGEGHWALAAGQVRDNLQYNVVLCARSTCLRFVKDNSR